jgi:hypothetical protein
MRKDEQQRQEPKGKYRVKNWPAYNAGLIARGDVTIWMGRDLWQPGAEADAVRRGRPRVYADAVIQMLLGLKQVFRLPLRSLQGFAASMNKLAFADLPVPNYTTLCRRARDLDVVLPTLRSGEPLHLVVDSTDVPLEGAHGQEPGGAHDWRPGHRGSHPRRCAQSHDLAGAPPVRPYRVNSWGRGKVPVRLDLCNNASISPRRDSRKVKGKIWASLASLENSHKSSQRREALGVQNHQPHRGFKLSTFSRVNLP